MVEQFDLAQAMGFAAGEAVRVTVVSDDIVAMALNAGLARCHIGPWFLAPADDTLSNGAVL